MREGAVRVFSTRRNPRIRLEIYPGLITPSQNFILGWSCEHVHRRKVEMSIVEDVYLVSLSR
jgi:hypothetical protein